MTTELEPIVAKSGLAVLSNLADVPTMRTDRQKVKQILVNLVKNAVEAASETNGKVRVGWSKTAAGAPFVEIHVDDEGPGLSNTGNLFVPFFTTKPGWSGI